MIRKVNQGFLRMLKGLPETCEDFPFESFSHISGQAAAIRFFDPNSIEDFELLKEILSVKEVRSWMDDSGNISKSDYQEWAGKWTNDSFLFAVHDAREKLKRKLKIVRGFVNIYSERSEKFRIKRMVRAGFVKGSLKNRHVLEVSMALRPLSDGKIVGSGLMSSALRQCCLQVRSLLGYPKQSDLILYGFVDPDNMASARALEASGFVKRGKMKYDQDSEKDSWVYILSWRKLHRKIKGGLLKLYEEGSNECKVKVDLNAQKTDSHCGPAVVQGLLSFFDISVSQDEVVEAAKVKSRLKKHGMRPDQIYKAVKFLAPNLSFWFKQNANSRDLDLLINKYELPVVVNWQGLFYDTVKEEKLGNPDGDRGHYSIAVDFKSNRDQITIADPYSDYVNIPRVFSYRWFKKRWWDVDHISDRKTKKINSIYTKKLILVLAPKDLVLPENLHLESAKKLFTLGKKP